MVDQEEGSALATAWVLDIGTFVQQNWCFERLAMGSTYHFCANSSFTMESLALAEGLQQLRDIVSGRTYNEPLGKRRRY